MDASGMGALDRWHGGSSRGGTCTARAFIFLDVGGFGGGGRGLGPRWAVRWGRGAGGRPTGRPSPPFVVQLFDAAGSDHSLVASPFELSGFPSARLSIGRRQRDST